jgi:predicted transcriptional regulator
MFQQIFLKNLDAPFEKEKDLNNNISWICESFCLSSGRDINNIAAQVFKEILAKQRAVLVSSNYLSDEMDLSIGVVNYHLRNLIDSGFLFRKKKSIFIRGGCLKYAVQELRKDTELFFDRMESIAEKIDEKMNLNISQKQSIKY